MTTLSAFVALAAVVFLAWRLRAHVNGLQRRVAQLSRQLDERTAELANTDARLKQLAMLDGVTGVATHGHFQDSLRAEWRRALREASPVSVIMADIDHFREYNDAFGHEAGDVCLGRVAQTIGSLIDRPGDLVARYGGGQFAVILARTDQPGSVHVADELRAAVEALHVPHPRSPIGDHVTVSIGVASATPALDSNWEELELVAAADRAVKQAKASGRNRVVA